MAKSVTHLTPEKVLAVLVTYGTPATATASWQSLRASEAGQSLQWLVYDNSPHRLEDLPADIHYEHHPDNPGVSAAYLRAAQRATSIGASWLLLLDQDSIFEVDWFAQYAEAVLQYPDQQLFVPLVQHGETVVSPAPMRWGRAWASTEAPAPVFDLAHYACINAGMLIELAAYQRSGGHLAEVALDFSDTAFLYFFRRQQPTGVLVPSKLEHRLSGAEKVGYAQRLHRFKLYCRDGRAFVNSGGPRLAIFGWMLWRAVLLSVRYRRFGFFWVFSRALFTH